FGGRQRGSEVGGYLGAQAGEERGGCLGGRAAPAGAAEDVGQLPVAERQDGGRVATSGADVREAALPEGGPPHLEAGSGGGAEERERQAERENGGEAPASNTPPELARRAGDLPRDV